MQPLSNQRYVQRYSANPGAPAGGFTWAEVDQSAANLASLNDGSIGTGLSVPPPVGLHALVERKQGDAKPAKSLAPALAPVRAILKLRDYWAVTDEEMCRICGLPDSALPFASRLVAYFSVPDIQRRLRSLMSIRARLSALFEGDQETERQWLRASWSRLGQMTPLSVMISAEDLIELVRLEALVRELTGG